MTHDFFFYPFMPETISNSISQSAPRLEYYHTSGLQLPLCSRHPGFLSAAEIRSNQLYGINTDWLLATLRRCGSLSLLLSSLSSCLPRSSFSVRRFRSGLDQHGLGFVSVLSVCWFLLCSASSLLLGLVC